MICMFFLFLEQSQASDFADDSMNEPSQGNKTCIPVFPIPDNDGNI